MILANATNVIYNGNGAQAVYYNGNKIWPTATPFPTKGWSASGHIYTGNYGGSTSMFASNLVIDHFYGCKSSQTGATFNNASSYIYASVTLNDDSTYRLYTAGLYGSSKNYSMGVTADLSAFQKASASAGFNWTSYASAYLTGTGEASGMSASRKFNGVESWTAKESGSVGRSAMINTALQTFHYVFSYSALSSQNPFNGLEYYNYNGQTPNKRTVITLSGYWTASGVL